MVRDVRQKKIFDWCKEVFGDVSATPYERALRFLEEAIELAQASGVIRDDAIRLAHHVYNAPCGSVDKEAGAVSVTLLAYCESVGLSADDEEQREVARVTGMDREKMRDRYLNKVRLGLAAPPMEKK